MMFCKDCKYLRAYIPEHEGDTGYSFCMVLMRKGLLGYDTINVNSETDYCSFGKTKEIEQ